MNAAVETVLLVALTVFAYALSLATRKRWPHPLTTPVLFATVLIIAVLFVTRVNVTAYEPAKKMLTLLLGPATVALALPLYRNRSAFAHELVPALTGLFVGSLGTMIVAVLCARAFHLGRVLEATLAVKSVTNAIAVDTARIVHGDPTLAAGFVVCTGMLGASLGPWLLDRGGVRNPVARGISFGAISQGQGTAQAAHESELLGAVAGLAMGLGAIFTSLAAPLLVPLLTR